MPICIVVNAHELVVRIADVPSASTNDPTTQIHGAPSAHEHVIQSDEFF